MPINYLYPESYRIIFHSWQIWNSLIILRILPFLRLQLGLLSPLFLRTCILRSHHWETSEIFIEYEQMAQIDEFKFVWRFLKLSIHSVFTIWDWINLNYYLKQVVLVLESEGFRDESCLICKRVIFRCKGEPSPFRNHLKVINFVILHLWCIIWGNDVNLKPV